MNSFAARTILASLLLAAAPELLAQRTLQQLQRQFRAEKQKLEATSPTFEKLDALYDRHTAELRRFAQAEATGDDRWRARVLLCDFEIGRRHRDEAIAALRGIDADAAPALVLVQAASRAQYLALEDLRDAFVERALAKDAPLEDRLQMAEILMTEVSEVEKGEAIYTEALAAATDDEQRARIRFARADALRNREDLPENTGFDELEALARDLPNTYWGQVARDRARASRLRLGDAAIDFTARTLTGDEISLAKLRGRPVVLAFWQINGYGTEHLVSLLRELKTRHPSLAIVSVCLDEDLEEVRQAVRSLGIDFPVIADGKGRLGDVALRWFAEGEAVHVIDAKGRLAGMGLTTATNDGRRELRAVIERVAG